MLLRECWKIVTLICCLVLMMSRASGKAVDRKGITEAQQIKNMAQRGFDFTNIDTQTQNSMRSLLTMVRSERGRICKNGGNDCNYDLEDSVCNQGWVFTFQGYCLKLHSTSGSDSKPHINTWENGNAVVG